MPSDVSMKIAAAWYKATTTLDAESISNLAEHLDSMGVGDAFSVIKDNWYCNKLDCERPACSALRKAGLV